MGMNPSNPPLLKKPQAYHRAKDSTVSHTDKSFYERQKLHTG